MVPDRYDEIAPDDQAAGVAWAWLRPWEQMPASGRLAFRLVQHATAAPSVPAVVLDLDDDAGGP